MSMHKAMLNFFLQLFLTSHIIGLIDIHQVLLSAKIFVLGL